MEESFDQMLRLNLLEMMNYSRTFQNRKRYSDADLMIQVDQLYQFAKQKPTFEDLHVAITFLLKRSLIDDMKMGDLYVYTITENGRETLTRIADGDDTVIY